MTATRRTAIDQIPVVILAGGMGTRLSAPWKLWLTDGYVEAGDRGSDSLRGNGARLAEVGGAR